MLTLPTEIISIMIFSQFVAQMRRRSPVQSNILSNKMQFYFEYKNDYDPSGVKDGT